jgi:diguanylate cyclase (GGDEF)-like protein
MESLWTLVRRYAGRPLVGYAVLSAACVVLLGAVLAGRLSQILERRALLNVAAQATTAVAIAESTFASSGHRTPGRTDLVVFSRQTKELAAREGASALEVVTPDGSLGLLGRPPRDPHATETLRRVLDGGTAVTRRLGRDYLLYVPLRVPGQPRPQAMLAATMRGSLVRRGLDRDLRGLYVILGAALALLWAMLVPIFARVSRQLRRHAEENERLARLDGLTGLANRSWFYEQALDAARRGRVGALVIDVDGFKDVNDTLGHGAGDEVLRAFGRRLRAAVRDDDVVGRIGGDEFAIVVRRIDRATLEAVAARIVGGLAEPVRHGEGLVRVGVSVGVAAPRGDGEVDLGRLLSEADNAMYRAKRAGGGASVLELV